MKDANKSFTIFIGLSIIFGLIAGLCVKLEYLGAGGIFTSITSVLLILGLPWGFYPNPINVRKRNFLRFLMFLFLFHIFVFGVIGTSEATVSALNIDNATKSAETISKTFSNVQEIKAIGTSILKFESMKFEKILWVYVVFLVGISIPIYKLLRSWGWGFIICFGIACAIGFCCWYRQNFLTANWMGILLIITLSLFGASICFIIKHWKNPAIA